MPYNINFNLQQLFQVFQVRKSGSKISIGCREIAFCMVGDFILNHTVDDNSTGVTVQDRKIDTKCCHSGHTLKRSDFHFSESQRVPVALPVPPHHTIIVLWCVDAGVVVVAVQVGVTTAVVPPATFVRHCTRAWPRVVVLVSSAELKSKMIHQCIAFTQQIEHRHVSLTLFAVDD